jgi:hypothetical protein
MARVIEPPKNQLNCLLTPLTDGERRVVELFDDRLDSDWEIYIQPHLNGLRPDIVLLHPRVGVAVFEIKDWDLSSLQYYSQPKGDGGYALMGVDKQGHHFSLEARNPVSKILVYKNELFNLYCPRLDDKAGLAVITAGVILPFSPRSIAHSIFEPLRNARDEIRDFPRYHPISYKEDIDAGDINRIFPESSRSFSRVMSRDIADDLRSWLREPFFSREQRTPLILDGRQLELASTRTATGYRRIKGPAGSGKSVILAARASTLAAEERHVLVVGFNITLLNYLRDLSVRHEASRKVVRRQIDFLNFHNWCKRVCLAAGYEDKYKKIWAASFDGDDLQVDPVLTTQLPQLVQHIYRNEGINAAKYDAILVDEGQDMNPLWWQTLRLALKDGGEMLLVADKTQNIYATASAWTEEAMSDAGFRGQWAELKVSYRLPPSVVPLVSDFADRYLKSEEVDMPQLESDQSQMEISGLYPVDLRWVHVDDSATALNACLEELRLMMKGIPRDAAIPDVTFLSGKAMGRKLVEHMERKNFHILHTFHEDSRSASRQKRAFFQGSARVKATTLHSFKGWESRYLLLFVESVERAEDRALIYTALTRLRRDESGSALTVVSSCEDLLPYGRTWPSFKDPSLGSLQPHESA